MAGDANAQATYVQPAPDPELKRLETLVGEWNAEGETQESPAGPAGKVTSRETFRWLEGGYFLVSTWLTVFGDAPPQKGVMYWGYDAEARTFRTHFFDNQGPFHEGSMYEGVVGGGRLTFTGPARFQYELDADGKIRVNPDGTITTVWWLHDGDGAWQPWMINVYTRARR